MQHKETGEKKDVDTNLNVPSSQSTPNQRAVSSKKTAKPAQHRSTSLPELLNGSLSISDTSTEENPEKEENTTLPSINSGLMDRRFESAKKVFLPQSKELEFQSKHAEKFAQNINDFKQQGYNPIIACDYPTALPVPNITKEYQSNRDFSSGQASSVCLFEKDQTLHVTYCRDMLGLYSRPPSMKPIQDGSYIYVILAKEVGDDITSESTIHEKKTLLELRVLPLRKSGHPTLVDKKIGEDKCVVAAGEFYIKDGKIVLINDKSGNFFEQVKNIVKKAELNPKTIPCHVFGSQYTESFLHYTRKKGEAKLAAALHSVGYSMPASAPTLALPIVSTNSAAMFAQTTSAPTVIINVTQESVIGNNNVTLL